VRRILRSASADIDKPARLSKMRAIAALFHSVENSVASESCAKTFFGLTQDALPPSCNSAAKFECAECYRRWRQKCVAAKISYSRCGIPFISEKRFMRERLHFTVLAGWRRRWRSSHAHVLLCSQHAVRVHRVGARQSGSAQIQFNRPVCDLINVALARPDNLDESFCQTFFVR
jgi:hypothetical protein